MESIQFKGHIGQDGILRVQMPAEFKDRDLEGIVCFQVSNETRVMEVIDPYAPMVTISSGEFTDLSQDSILAALLGSDEANEPDEEKLLRLERKANAIIANRGKAKAKREQTKVIKLLASQIGCSFEDIKKALQKLGGHLGAAEGLRKHGNDLAFLKAYIAQGLGTSLETSTPLDKNLPI